MNIEKCIEFANNNKICFLASAENNQPHVRALGFWYADTTGFYFQIGFNKDMLNQLKANPKSEVCFYENISPAGNMLRVEGDVEFVDSPELREKVFNDRPFLKSFGLTIDSPYLIMFRIPHGRCHLWTPENNLKPKEYIQF